MGQENTGETE